MKKSLLRWVSVCGLGASALAMSGSAHADPTCPEQQVIFLFDQSSSMLDDGPTPGRAKWKDALDRALGDLKSVPLTSQISIIGFGNTSPGDANYYHPLITFADQQIKTAQNESTFSSALSTIAVPQSIYATPLAAGACDAINEVWTYNTNCTLTTRRVVYLYSDGLENSTPDGTVDGVPAHACFGPRSGGRFNDALKGQGFGLDPDSWEWKVANLAYTGSATTVNNPDLDPVPEFRPVWNVRVLFDNANNLAGHRPGIEGARVLSQNLQDNVDQNGVAFFQGLTQVTYGTYSESKLIGGTPSKLALPGDTDPSPTRSCVDQADSTRVIGAFGHKVGSGDPKFSAQDLASRDVNHDLIINILDYQLVMQNYGRCS